MNVLIKIDQTVNVNVINFPLVFYEPSVRSMYHRKEDIKRLISGTRFSQVINCKHTKQITISFDDGHKKEKPFRYEWK